MKLLSIIIPTYNMEKYLEKCLNSLLIKDNLEKLEVLVINDGSKDQSLKIAQKYERQYPQIIRVIDKENGNYGSCINRGLKEATGKYIKILDADDSYDTELLNQYIKEIENQNVDMIVNDFVLVNLENKEIATPHTYSFIPKKKISFLEYKNTNNIEKLCMHSVAYKRQNLIELNYIQTEGISYTDTEWVFLPLSKVINAYYFNKPLYRYLIGREGQTMDINIYIKNSSQLLLITSKFIKHYIKYPNNEYKNILQVRILREIAQLYRIYITEKFDKIEELIKLDDILKKDCPDIYIKTNDLKIFHVFKYIKEWRNHNRKKQSTTLKLGIIINNILKKIKRSIHPSELNG